jgi:PPOX class probable F420-dependent enzyme
MERMEPKEQTFLDDHVWAVLATTRRDGSPQQSMVGYVVDDEGRLVISTKAYTAKWHNVRRRPSVSLTVPDGRVHLVIDGTVELIEDDPLRAELTADAFVALFGGERPDPAALIPTLDEERRTVLRLTPSAVRFHE